MTTQHDLGPVKRSIVVETIILEELAVEMRTDGYDDVADELERVASDLQERSDPIVRVKLAAPRLRDLERNMRSKGLDKLADEVRDSRRKMTHQADSLLEDTARLSTGEYPMASGPPPLKPKGNV